jgi:hypothetical protein
MYDSRPKTADATSNSATATDAGATRIKSDPAFRAAGFDKQSETLAVQKKDAAGATTDPTLDALLKKAAADPAKNITNDFCTQLKAHAAKLTGPQCETLIELIPKTTRHYKLQLLTAIGAPPLNEAEGTRKMGDAELDALFMALIRMPLSARTDPAVMKSISGTNDSATYMKGEIKMSSLEVSEDIAVKQGLEKKAGGRAKYASTVRHEMGHGRDYADHPGNTHAFFKNAGWQVYETADAFITAHNATETAPGQEEVKVDALADPSRKLAVARNYLEKIRNTGMGATVDGAVAEAKSKGGPGADGARWFESTKGAEIVRRNDLTNFRNRYKEAGQYIGFWSPAKAFMATASGLSSQLDAWGNSKAGFSPREWAAECYAAWFDLEKAGDKPGGRPDRIANIGSEATAWLEKVPQ